VKREMFRKMLDDLGPMSYEEMAVATNLAILIVMWFSATSWKAWLLPEPSFVNNGCIGLILTLPLFLIPSAQRLPMSVRRLFDESRLKSECSRPTPKRILDWDPVKNNFTWEILFIFGGGSLVAHGSEVSGLAEYIAHHLASLDVGEFTLVVFIVVIVCFITEVVSNMATLNIFGPLIVQAAIVKCYDPVKLLLSTCFACSMAFMLPMAGGPNMIVYSTGRVSMGQMAKAGISLNIIGICAVVLYCHFVMPSIAGDWSRLSGANCTQAAQTI